MSNTFDLEIDQGATKRLNISYTFRSGGTDEDPEYTPYDLSECTARMQIRANYNTPVLVECTTENGDITLSDGLVDGDNVYVHIPASKTEALELRKARYDLEIVFPSGDVERILGGVVRISLNVTEDV